MAAWPLVKCLDGAEPARCQASYEDGLRAPQHLIAEVVSGVLYTSPRPAGPSAEAASVLGMDLGGAFHRSRAAHVIFYVYRSVGRTHRLFT
jgi:hypothetical protein